MEPMKPSLKHDPSAQPDLAKAHDETQEHAVRFASQLQEIEPEHSLNTVASLSSNNPRPNEELSPEAQQELRNLSKTLRESHLQQGRMSNFAFEPVSLPVSRVGLQHSFKKVVYASAPMFVRHGIRELQNSSNVAGELAVTTRPSAAPSIHTPPLTPAISPSQDGRSGGSGNQTAGARQGPVQITPQTSGPQRSLEPTVHGGHLDSGDTSLSAYSRPSSSSDQISTRPSTLSEGSGVTEALPKQAPNFQAGPGNGSLPPSRDESPSGSARTESGTVTPPVTYSRPFTPVGERDDPYARSRRPPQSRNLDTIDARFIFGGKDSRRQSAMVTSAANLGPLPRSNSGNDIKSQERPQSTFSLHSLAGKKDHHHGHIRDEAGIGKPHGSMSDLKRFLRIGHSKEKRAQSPTSSAKSSLNTSGVRTPPHQLPPANVPFADDHGLENKYGRFGKVLGSGAGGSVRLLKRSGDGVTFAVKQFRDRHPYESEREYNKKVTAEFCIGSTLHHGNIIETLDIIQERGHWYEVMEYAPYDLFAIVMTGKMSREEVACSFLQIFAGVVYLHSMGLAHRDLKLDNVVVNEHGIMKLIDFGSACVFRYPFENDIVLATGVVGSDPYLAPEVYDNARYDPQPPDVWSLAIIFACMSLRRFPWKAPRISDNSYKLFISPPSPGTPPAEGGLRRTSEQRPKSMMELPAAGEDRRRSAPCADNVASESTDDPSTKHSHHHNNRHPEAPPAEAGVAGFYGAPSPGPRIDAPNSKQEVIKGPWRLLRLLPRESRHIVGRMLEVDPKRRATLEEMMEDPWISTTPVCTQIEGGKVIRAAGHEHTLEPSTADPPAPVRK
ncbi:serine/threonine protein kinase [Lambiella insularis]|nr:serine/threonine protein kinase [Lambiella insularis]